MTDTDGSFDAPQYSPPGVLRLVRSMLSFPRSYKHTTNFSDLVSPDRSNQKDYAYGLLVFASLLMAVLVLWIGILVIFKCRGEKVGCASGRAFRTRQVEDEEVVEDGNHGSKSTDIDEMTLSQNDSDPPPADFLPSEDSFDGFASSQDSNDNSNLLEDTSPSADGRAINRARRTRLAFLLAGLATFFSVPAMLSLAFSPLRESVQESEETFATIDELIASVRATIATIQSSTMNSRLIVMETPSTFPEICPSVDQAQAELILGTNYNNALNGLASVMDADFVMLESIVISNTTEVAKSVDRVEELSESIEYAITTTEEYMWIVPGLLLAICATTAAALLGTVLAWKKQSGPCMQRSLSYLVLPTLIALSLTCWVFAMGASISSMMSADLCMGGASGGDPSDTIADILEQHNYGLDSTTARFISAYATGCKDIDPTESLVELRERVQNTVDAIWQYLSSIDSEGRAKLSAMCGDSVAVEGFLSTSRNLAVLLSSVRKAIDTTTGNLRCDFVGQIYIDSVQVSLCEEAAGASAWAFIFFLVMSISTMIMVTLRASFLHEEEEDKVYHDEQEVVENMVLDEHEEYLHYISKYKHEWQEYHGLDSNMVRRSSRGGSGSDARSSTGTDSHATSGYIGSDEWVQDDLPDTGPEDEVDDYDDDKARDPYDPYFDAPENRSRTGSNCTDDISFPSLRVTPTDEDVLNDSDLFVLPPPLLPPTISTEEAMRNIDEKDPTGRGAVAGVTAPVDPDASPEEMIKPVAVLSGRDGALLEVGDGRDCIEVQRHEGSLADSNKKKRRLAKGDEIILYGGATAASSTPPRGPRSGSVQFNDDGAANRESMKGYVERQLDYFSKFTRGLYSGERLPPTPKGNGKSPVIKALAENFEGKGGGV